MGFTDLRWRWFQGLASIGRRSSWFSLGCRVYIWFLDSVLSVGRCWMLTKRHFFFGIRVSMSRVWGLECQFSFMYGSNQIGFQNIMFTVRNSRCSESGLGFKTCGRMDFWIGSFWLDTQSCGIPQNLRHIVQTWNLTLTKPDLARVDSTNDPWQFHWACFSLWFWGLKWPKFDSNRVNNIPTLKP